MGKIIRIDFSRKNGSAFTNQLSPKARLWLKDEPADVINLYCQRIESFESERDDHLEYLEELCWKFVKRLSPTVRSTLTRENDPQHVLNRTVCARMNKDARKLRDRLFECYQHAVDMNYIKHVI